MARKYAKNKGKRKKRNYRYRSRAVTGVSSIFPKSRRAILRYNSKMTLSSAYGALTSDYVNLNGCYQVESSGGHQPMGWDEHTALYNHYVVVGARVSCKVLDYTVGAAGPSMIGICVTDTATPPYTTYSSFVEAKKGSWRTLTNQRNQVSFGIKYSTRKFFNITDVKDNMDRLGASIGANPSEIATGTIWYQCLNSSDVDSTVIIAYTIDYIIEFSEPKDPTAS